MNGSRVVALTAVAAASVAIAPAAWAFSLVAEIVEVGSGKSVAATVVRAETEQEGRELTRRLDGVYAADIAAPKKRFAVSVRVAERLVSRTIDLRVPDWTLRAQSRLTVHVTDSWPVTHREFRKRRDCVGTSQRDPCLALFEYAAHIVSASKLTDLRVGVEYYHGLALRDACEFLKYDTCQKAVERFDALLGLFGGNEVVFQSASITEKMLKRAREVALKVTTTNQVAVVQQLYASKRYDQAALTAEETIAFVRDASVDLSHTGVSVDALRRDAASSWSLWGDEVVASGAGDRTVALQGYEKAVSLLKAITTLDRGEVLKNLELLNGKITALKTAGSS